MISFITKINKPAEIIFMFTLIFLAFVMIPIRTVYLGDAAGNNLAYGLSLLENGEPLFFRRGPVYYAFIAFFFKLFGVSVEHAVWVTRFFVLMNLSLIYFMLRTMFRPLIAIIATVLIFFSYALNLEALKLEVDNVFPFFLILTLWLSWFSVKKQSKTLAVSSGVILGIAWLTKEAALLLLPIFFVPFIFKPYRSRKTFILASLSIVSFLIILIPWFLYAHTKGVPFSGAIGYLSPDIMVGRSFGPSETSMIEFLFEAVFLNSFANLKNYLGNYFIPNFPLWLPLIVSFFYVVFDTFRKKSLELAYLTGGAFLFLPLPIFQGSFGERLGQAYFLFFILYIFLAYSLTEAFRYFSMKFRLKAKSVNLIFAFLMALLVAFELFNPLGWIAKSTAYLWLFSERRPLAANHLLGMIPTGIFNQIAETVGISQEYVNKFEDIIKNNRINSGFILDERFDQGIQEAMQWILHNVPPGTRLMHDGHLDRAIEFYTKFNYSLKTYEKKFDYVTSYKTNSFKDLGQGSLLAAITYHNFESLNVPRYRLVQLVFEDNLLTWINEFNPSYLIVFRPDSVRKRYSEFYERYFSSQPVLTPVFENHRSLILKVNRPLNPIREIVDVPYFNSSFENDLIWLNNHFPNEFNNMKKLFEDLNYPLEKSMFLPHEPNP